MHVCCKKFANGQESVAQWERSGRQPASFFAPSIQKLVNRWDKYLNEFG